MFFLEIRGSCPRLVFWEQRARRKRQGISILDFMSFRMSIKSSQVEFMDVVERIDGMLGD